MTPSAPSASALSRCSGLTRPVQGMSTRRTVGGSGVRALALASAAA